MAAGLGGPGEQRPRPGRRGAGGAGRQLGQDDLCRPGGAAHRLAKTRSRLCPAQQLFPRAPGRAGLRRRGAGHAHGARLAAGERHLPGRPGHTPARRPEPAPGRVAPRPEPHPGPGGRLPRRAARAAGGVALLRLPGVQRRGHLVAGPRKGRGPGGLGAAGRAPGRGWRRRRAAHGRGHPRVAAARGAAGRGGAGFGGRVGRAGRGRGHPHARPLPGRDRRCRPGPRPGRGGGPPPGPRAAGGRRQRRLGGPGPVSRSVQWLEWHDGLLGAHPGSRRDLSPLARPGHVATADAGRLHELRPDQPPGPGPAIRAGTGGAAGRLYRLRGPGQLPGASPAQAPAPGVGHHPPADGPVRRRRLRAGLCPAGQRHHPEQGQHRGAPGRRQRLHAQLRGPLLARAALLRAPDPGRAPLEPLESRL